VSYAVSPRKSGTASRSTLSMTARFPAFAAVLAIFWLMIAKPELPVLW